MRMFVAGDRVIRKGLPWLRGEEDRRGVVVETYVGAKSMIDPGVPMLAVQFDDGKLERGFINGSGSLIEEPLAVPTCVVVE